MPPEFDLANIRPDLYRALAECGIDPEKIPGTAARLTNPPISLHLSSWDPPGTASTIQSVVGFDPDTAAWAALTRAERKKAKRLYDWALGPDDLGVVPKGRPPEIDSAFVLWCLRVVGEASGQHLSFARRWEGGRPLGLEAFMLVLHAAWAPLGRLVATITGNDAIGAFRVDDQHHVETIAQIVKLDRASSNDRSAKIFAEKCRTYSLGRTADDVANNPQMFRFAVMSARAEHRRTRRPKPVPY